MCQCPASFVLFRLLVVARAAVFVFAAPPAFFPVEDFLFVFRLDARFFVPVVLLFRSAVFLRAGLSFIMEFSSITVVLSFSLLLMNNDPYMKSIID